MNKAGLGAASEQGEKGGEGRRVWMLTAGRGEDDQAAEWVAGGCCATSYREAGKTRAGAELAEVRAVLDETYPNEKEESRRTWATQLRDFLSEDVRGDWVLTAEEGTVHLGVITGKPQYTRFGDAVPRRRGVEWLLTVPRTSLPAGRRGYPAPSRSSTSTRPPCGRLSGNICRTWPDLRSWACPTGRQTRR